MQIKDLLQRDLSETIEEVIKLGQDDEASVYKELTEYVATNRIRDHYRRLLQAIADAPADPHEGIGVWISGFFGSGKSSFAKNLGYVLANRTVQDHAAADLFKRQLADEAVSQLVDFITTTIPIEVIMFDVSTDRSVNRNERLAEVIYRVVLRELGYAEDYQIAELEIELEQEGQLAPFIACCREQYGDWRLIRKGAQKMSRASALLHEMDSATYPTADAWERSALKRTPDITIAGVVNRTFELMERRRPGKALVLIIDEVGQYVARSAEKIEDLRAVVEQFGKESKNRVRQRRAVAPVWLVVTSQEKLSEVVDAIDSKRVELAKLQDRFRWHIDLAPADIREVATRRVLGKREDALATLKQRYAAAQGQLNTACHLQDTSRQSEVRESTFVQFYPYLPHFVDLSIDIMSGIRLQPGAPQHLGGSNRTIIKQAQQMLISDRTKVAERQVGALVTLDLIYELVEGNLSSERQKDISDISQRWEDGGWAARVAKVICLLEYVHDLPRTEGNIAALLVDEIGKPAPLAEVKDALERLERAQFIRFTQEGYKLQTAQEKRWDSERQGYRDPKPKDRNEIKREVLRDIFDDRFKTYRYHELRTFRVGITVDGVGSSETGQVLLALLVAEDDADFLQKLSEARSNSRSDLHRNEIYWVFSLTSEIDELMKQLYASREMIKKYNQVSSQGRITGEQAASLEDEKHEEAQLLSRLREKFSEAITNSGQGLFRGVSKDAAELGKQFSETFKHLFDFAIPDLYPKLEMGARPLKSSDVEEILKAANLNGLPQVFYSGAQGLNLVVKEDGRFVPNAHAETAKEVLDFLKREHTYGNKVAGKDLEIHFTQKPGYGWELDMVRLVLATLLRAGAIEVTYQGHRYHNHLDPLCRTPLTTITAFRAASFAPHESIELQTLTTAVKHYEELVGAEVDVEEGAIAEALKKIANDEMKLLLPVCAEASAYKLPFRSVLDTYQENLAEILNADSDDCVRILAGEGNTLKAIRDQVRRIRQAMAEGHLIMLIQQARLAAEEQWPLLQSTTAGPPLLPQKEALRALLVSETCYEELQRIRSFAQAITEAYQAHYQAQHRARFEEYSQAIDEIKGHVRWPLVPESARASVLGQLEYCACQEEAELLDGVLECQRCKASLIAIDAQRINIQTNKSQTLTRLYEITTPVGEMAHAQIRQVKASAFFSDVLESNEDLDEAIERLREHVRGLLAEGARVIVG